MFIAYLGSKRKFLDHISEQLPKGKILDLFSGSGVVASHLKQLGNEVHANDIAPYSFHINRTFLELNPESLSQNYPNLQSYFDNLNSLTEPSDLYFSTFYSQTNKISCPRLYYTEENGKKIDCILEEIWKQPDETLRSIVLTALFPEMTVHANTSGHFKTFHKEIGGRFKGGHIDRVRRYNIRRITAPVTLKIPTIPLGPIGRSYCCNANDFFNNCDTYDAIYIDPPYVAHQYSGNYHLLEQACRPLELRYMPRDDQISGIQPDLYKSPYCSKKTIRNELTTLFNTLKPHTKTVLLSYNSKGFISPIEMEELFITSFGNVSVVEIDYITFRGGMNRPNAKKPEKNVKEMLFKAIV